MGGSDVAHKRSRVGQLIGANGLALGAIRIAVRSWMKLMDTLWTICWRHAVAGCGRGTVIQFGTTFEYPKRVWLADDVLIHRYVRFTSETGSGELRIERGAQINQCARIDYTGGVYIGADTLVSEDVLILSHSHGDDPRSSPTPIPKAIGQGVWIGARAIVLERSTSIGDHSRVGSGAVVAKPVPANSVALGNPCIFRERRQKQSAV